VYLILFQFRLFLKIQREAELSLPPASADFLPGFRFDSEHGGDLFLPNVELSLNGPEDGTLQSPQ
jgi:hypothetical protein